MVGMAFRGEGLGVGSRGWWGWVSRCGGGLGSRDDGVGFLGAIR